MDRFFERSLQPAEGLWSVLHRIDVWPANVRKLDAPVATAGLEEWFDTASAKRAIAALNRNEKCAVMISSDNEEVAFHRALALVAHAGAVPTGILLPSVTDSTLEGLIGIHALVRGAVPVLKVAPPDGPNSRRRSHI